MHASTTASYVMNQADSERIWAQSSSLSAERSTSAGAWMAIKDYQVALQTTAAGVRSREKALAEKHKELDALQGNLP